MSRDLIIHQLSIGKRQQAKCNPWAEHGCPCITRGEKRQCLTWHRYGPFHIWKPQHKYFSHPLGLNLRILVTLADECFCGWSAEGKLCFKCAVVFTWSFAILVLITYIACASIICQSHVQYLQCLAKNEVAKTSRLAYKECKACIAIIKNVKQDDFSEIQSTTHCQK